MRRSVLIALIAVVGVLGGGLWWLGTGAEGPFPERQPVPGLRDSVVIQWTGDGLPVIEEEQPRGVLSALGYVHGLKRGWTAVLWRQTALGRLGRWFGPGVVPLDRHARQLGLAPHARSAYRQLPAAAQARLQAYARGMNAALQSEHVRQSDAFVLFDVEAAPWAPWHTLLVGRLLAWMGTPALSAPAGAPPAVTQFTRADRRLRRWLHLHGWGRSVAWAVRPPGDTGTPGPVLFQRHVLGASAAPILQEVLWDRPAAGRTTWSTLPGTLLFPTGTNGRRAWASLLRSPVRLTQAPIDSSQLRHWHERIDPVGGDEQLLRVDRLGDRLPLGLVRSTHPPGTTRSASSGRPADSLRAAPRDTAWVVQWPGFSPRSDLGAWLQRGGLQTPAPDSQSFGVFEADGLSVDTTGDWTPLGTPAVVDSTDHGVIVGQSRWVQAQARSLTARVARADTLAPKTWSASDSSTWAATLFPHLRPSLRQFASGDGALRTAIPYLRNWDFHYAPTSIGALVFEEWMRQYRTEIGHIPTLADTGAYFGRYRQRRALRRALDTLAVRLGPDVRRWRWEQGVTDRRMFPVWSADSVLAASLQDLRTSRYAPLTRTPRGHPSTLSGGPSLVDPFRVAPSPDTWTGWMRPGGPMTVRQPRSGPSAELARAGVRTDLPPARSLPDGDAAGSTLLVPSD